MTLLEKNEKNEKNDSLTACDSPDHTTGSSLISPCKSLIIFVSLSQSEIRENLNLDSSYS